MLTAQRMEPSPISTRNYFNKDRDHCLIVLTGEMVILEVTYFGMSMENGKATVYARRRNKDSGNLTHGILSSGVRFDGSIKEIRASAMKCAALEKYIERAKLLQGNQVGEYYKAMHIDEIEELEREDFEFVY